MIVFGAVEKGDEDARYRGRRALLSRTSAAVHDFIDRYAGIGISGGECAGMAHPRTLWRLACRECRGHGPAQKLGQRHALTRSLGLGLLVGLFIE